MALKCKARIYGTVSSGKATSIRPSLRTDANEVCGGNISLDVSLPYRGRCTCDEYCYCESPELEISVTCSRCRNAFIDDDLQSGYPYTRLKELIVKALEAE